MAQSCTVSLEPSGKKLKVTSGTPLVDVLHEYGVEFPCGGKGTCGKCRVKVLLGSISLSDRHREALLRLDLGKEFRLACMSRVEEDVSLEVEQYNTIILADESEFSITPGQGYGLAVDLGTTTIVAQLLELSAGKVMGVRTAVNPQARYGSDVISRIAFAVEKKGQKKLQELIHRTVSELIFSLEKECRVRVSRIVIVGNSVMQHIFCGFDLKPLSLYPFESRSKELIRLDPADLHPRLDKNITIHFLPSVGSFVGSDILAGMMAARIHESGDYQVLIDLGTNGEIVAGNRERILCASTAAGPAFEGTNISMGMRATTGAISSVWREDDGIHSHVIGNVPPRGICGSGLIDAVSVFLKKGRIDAGGQITGDADKLAIGGPVYLTQQDIREFQLAKAAIAAGLHILLKELGIGAKEVKQVFVAGAFGNFIDLSNARYLQLLEFPEESIRKMGNTALLGAKMALFGHDLSYSEVLSKTRHMSLESDPGFQDIFIGNMMFTGERTW
jgi:uncharacterized 2Fe-2S/4Fe-4S cluster protein (DUF4445 family)